MAKTYVGTRSATDEFVLQVNVEEGGASRPLSNVGLNDAGFEWGYGGSGPAALAYSILLDHLGDAKLAERLYQQFKEECISGLEHEGFRVEESRVAEWCARNKPASDPDQDAYAAEHERLLARGFTPEGQSTRAGRGETRRGRLLDCDCRGPCNCC
jgi:hypothetical protein